jgi:soluble lytic murein transglycosylase-like protein
MMFRPLFPCRFPLALAALLAAICAQGRAAEHITLRNGFELDCARQEATPGDRVRLYLLPGSPASASTQSAGANNNYIEVSANAILRTETIPDPELEKPGAPVPGALSSTASPSTLGIPPSASTTRLTPAETHELILRAGARHNIDADLLASVVQAESGGRVLAVSRAGAQGLMQLMPGTASELGVSNSFAPEQNIGGGTAYLDQMLTRYHDNIAMALAAYNAGPAAVDRYHSIPPYAETRAYVARVIREFNRRKRSAQTQ